MMKKNILKILIVLLFMFLITLKSYCADFNFSKSYISDNSNFLDNLTKEQLDDVLKNLHKETSTDLIILTVNSLGQGETYETIEQDVRAKYILGGENRDKWIMIILTRTPYQMNIRVGDGLKKVIPNSMKRAMGLEFWFSRIINGDRTSFLSSYGAQTNLYTTALILGEAVADENGVRLHTSDQIIDLYGIQYRENGVYIPRSTDIMKFVRRYNLYPVIIITGIGFLPFLIRRRRRRGLIGRIYGGRGMDV